MATANIHTTRVCWNNTHRLINSSFPPIDLFEDIADPRDWDLLCAAEAKTNPRINQSVGKLDTISTERRVSGKGASYVMAPFTHISKDFQGRFHDGTYGAYYAAESFETALFEVIHHREAFFASTNETAGWMTDLRELVGKIDQKLVDIRGDGFDDLLDKNDYSASQTFALKVKKFRTKRHCLSQCSSSRRRMFCCFYPDVISIPKQGKHIGLHWNGERINQIRVYQSPHNVIYEIEQ